MVDQFTPVNSGAGTRGMSVEEGARGRVCRCRRPTTTQVHVGHPEQHNRNRRVLIFIVDLQSCDNKVATSRR